MRYFDLLSLEWNFGKKVSPSRGWWGSVQPDERGFGSLDCQKWLNFESNLAFQAREEDNMKKRKSMPIEKISALETSNYFTTRIFLRRSRRGMIRPGVITPSSSLLASFPHSFLFPQLTFHGLPLMLLCLLPSCSLPLFLFRFPRSGSCFPS